MSCIPESGCCLFVPLFLHFSFSPIFKHWNFSSHSSHKLWGLEGWNLIHTWTVGGCMVYTRIRLLLLIHHFIFSFSNIQILIFSSHFSQELWGLEGWNLVHMWTTGGCIVYTRIRQLLHICSFICNIFVTPFSGTVRPRRLKHYTHVDSGWMNCVYLKFS